MGLYFLRKEKGEEEIEGEGMRETGAEGGGTKGEFGHRQPC